MESEQKWRFCVVGNIVKTHFDEEGVLRYGTKAFAGGKKVYLCGKYLFDVVDKMDDIFVIGQNRFGRYAFERVPIDLIENVRFKTVFKPHILEIMEWLEEMEGFPWWGRTADDKREAKAFVKAFNERALL